MTGYGMPIRVKGKVVGRGDMIVTFHAKGFWYLPPRCWRAAQCLGFTASSVLLLAVQLMYLRRMRDAQRLAFRKSHVGSFL